MHKYRYNVSSNTHFCLFVICVTVHHWYKYYKHQLDATSWVHYTTSCNTQSSAPEDGRVQRPKHVELIGFINKPLLLLVAGSGGIQLPGYRLPATSWVHYTTSYNTQSSGPEDGRVQRSKYVELIGFINKSLLLHLVGVYIIYIFVCFTLF